MLLATKLNARQVLFNICTNTSMQILFVLVGLDIGMTNLNLTDTNKSGQVNPFAAPTQESGHANPLITGMPTMTSPSSSVQQPLPYSSHKR